MCDVILTAAMVALTTLTPDARETFNGHLDRVASRSLGTPSLPRPPLRSAVTFRRVEPPVAEDPAARR